MSKEPNNIDRLVREKLDGFEMTPPPSVWENTSASLNTGRKKRLFLWFALGITALITLGTSAYYFSSEDTPTEQVAATNVGSKTNNSIRKNAKEENNANLDAGNSSAKKDNLAADAKLSTNSGNPSNDLLKKDSGISINDKGDFSTKKSDTRANDFGNTGDQRTLADQDQKDLSSKQNDSGKTDELNSQQNAHAHSAGSKHTENYSSLQTHPLQLLKSEEPMLATNTIEEDSLPVPIPFWKSLSVEGAIGMSTFKNQAKKSTSPNLLEVLNNVASGQSSFDFRFGVNYHFTDRFSFQSGLHYNASKENYSFNSSEIVTYSYIDTISFTVDSTTFDTTYIINTIAYDSTIVTANDGRNSYRILTLPFQFAWSQPISARGVLEFSLGGAISIFGKNTGSVIVDQTNFSLDAQQGYHTTGMLSLGGSIKYVHRFGNHHSVYAEPWAQFGITNQSGPQISYESLRRRYGVRVGYRFYF